MRWWLLLGGVLITVGLGWWVLQVTLMEPAERGTAAGYGQFVLAAVGLLIMAGGPVGKALAPAEQPGLDELADLLAAAMRNQWTSAANDRRLLQPAPLPIRWRRTTEPVAGPTAAAIDHTLFDPLPGLDRITDNRLRRGTRRDLHRVYGGLASGRLLIIGGPGAGKSSAAVLLLLDALRYRDQAPPADHQRIPVPVLFTLQNWDPATTPVQDWLGSKLTEIPMFRGRHGSQRAKTLLRDGRLAVFLDGLDEIPQQTQPLALQALSEQATFRLVLLTRTTELATAAQHHGLVGAVALELQPLTPTDAADYLLRPLTEPAPSAWRNLTTTLTSHPDSALGTVLTNPLTVSLLRDTYPPTAPADELLDTTRFPDPNDIANHLLDRAVTAAYTPRPGQPPPRYTPTTAQRTLTLIAHQLNNNHTRDLAWWTIPNWIPRTPRTLISALLATVLIGITVGLTYGLTAGLTAGLTYGPTAGLAAGLISALIGDNTPLRMQHLKWRQLLTPHGLRAGLVAGLTVGLTGGLTGGLADEIANATRSVSPAKTWRADLEVGLTYGLTAGLTYGLGAGLTHGLAYGLTVGLTVGLPVGLTVSAAGRVAVTEIYLTARYRTPLRLIRFLEDARSRHLLRTVGPMYQFRHATLQDRLASGPIPRTRIDSD